MKHVAMQKPHPAVFLVNLQAKGHGPPEMVSCGLDGCVRVWDVRQEDQPVASFEPLKGGQVSPYIDMADTASSTASNTGHDGKAAQEAACFSCQA